MFVRPSRMLFNAILLFRWLCDGPGSEHNFGEAQMIKQALGCVVVFGCLMVSAPLQAHHSTAGIYDPAKSGEVTGALSKLQFVNPHGSITITVKNADGTTTDWTFTTGSATALAERGITKVGPHALKIGEQLTVTFMPARNGAPLGALRTVKRADGTLVESDPEK